jgi:hypothetical protein
VVDRVRVEPRPGALIGSTGDGIHFRRSLRSNHIRNSYVTRTVDDGLVIDAVMAGRVAARLGPRDLRVQRTFYTRFPDGATINFVDAATGSEIAGGAIVSQAPPDSRAIEFNGLVTLTFDRDLPAVAPDSAVVFADSSMRGAGSSIEDNIVEDLVMGRAIWIGGAVGVTVRRNVARRASQGGVVISQTAGGGGISQTTDHSGVARDVTIQSNVLDGNLGPMAQGTITQVCMASIAVVSFNSTGTGFQFLPSPLNTNILIRDNYIVDSGRTGIWMGETAGGRIENNLITRWYQQPHLPLWFVAPDVRAQVLEDHSQPSVLRYSAGVLVQNNDIRAASTIAAPVSFSTPVIALPSGGGASSFTVTPVVVGFQWKAVTADPWISVTTAEGTGSGTVAFSVSLNPGPSARTGYVTVAGQRVTVVQAGAPMITPGFMALAPAEVNGTLVRFNWSLPVGGQPATGFTLVARLVPGGTPVASLPVGAVQSLTVPAPAGVYYVRVFGTNAAGFGPDSNEVVVVVGGGAVPGAPRNLTAVVTGNAFLLAWTPPVNAAIAPVQTYVIDAGSVPGASDLASFATGSATTQFTTPMIPNGSYYISLRARNELGTGPASAEIRAIVGPPPPGAVTLSGSAGPGNSVSLSWTAPTTGAAVTGYQLQAGTMPGSSNAAVLNLPASTRSFTTAGVPSGRYYVRVVALSTQGPSPASNELTLMFP